MRTASRLDRQSKAGVRAVFLGTRDPGRPSGEPRFLRESGRVSGLAPKTDWRALDLLKGNRAVAVACGILAALGAAAFAPFTYDDGYITYRYASNLASGRGFAFNSGEAVLGTTAPVYGLTLASLGFLTRVLAFSVAAWGSVLSLLSLAAAVLSLQTIRQEEPSGRRTLEGIFLAVLVFSARWNIEMLGSETVSVLGLLSIAFALAVRRRNEALSGLAAGLAASFRFDAGLAVAALGAALWRDRRAFPWSYCLAGAAPIAASLGWLWVTFGTWLPNTLEGKRSEFALVALGYTRSEYEWFVRSMGSAGALTTFIFALGGIAVVSRVRGRPFIFLVAFGAWLLAHEALYRIANVPFAPWYHLSAFNAILALAVAGVFAFARWITAARGWLREGLRTPVAAVVCGFLLLPVLSPAGSFFRDHFRRPPDPRIRIYRDVALEIASRSDKTGSVAAVEIGAIAYFSDRRVIDLVGLVDPEMLRARREGKVAELVFARRPDFIVDNPGFHDDFLAPLLAGGQLGLAYRELATFRRPEYPHPIRLLGRRDGLDPQPEGVRRR